MTVSDASGQVVRRFTAPASAGINRVAWDLRLQPTDPVNGPPYEPDPDFPFASPPLAPFVLPGTYQVALSKRVDGVFTPLGAPQRFQVVDVDSVPGRAMATLADQRKVAELERSVLGTSALVGETLRRVGFLKRAIDETPTADTSLARRVRVVEQRLHRCPGNAHGRSDARASAGGDDAVARRATAGCDRQSWGNSLSALNPSQTAQIEFVRREFGVVLARVTQLVDVELKGVEDAAERAGVPWTSGRIPKAPF